MFTFTVLIMWSEKTVVNTEKQVSLRLREGRQWVRKRMHGADVCSACAITRTSDCQKKQQAGHTTNKQQTTGVKGLNGPQISAAPQVSRKKGVAEA